MSADLKGHWFFVTLPQDYSQALPAVGVVEDKALSHHLRTVMRIRQGDSLVLVDEARGLAYGCEFVRADVVSVEVRVLRVQKQPPKTQPVVMAAVALIKGQRWDWMLQKLTELGVDEVLPVIAERSVVTLKEDSAKQARWNEILKNAAEQSERYTIPALRSPVKVEALSTIQAVCKWVASERGGLPLKNLTEQKKCPESVLFAIGPEGGWSSQELALLETFGFVPVTLGDTILRSETAAMYMASVLRYCYV